MRESLAFLSCLVIFSWTNAYGIRKRAQQCPSVEAWREYIANASRKECSLESEIKPSREQIQELSALVNQAKKTLEILKLSFAKYKNKQLEDEERRAKDEKEFQRLIMEKDEEIAREKKARAEAEAKVQALLKRLEMYESWPRPDEESACNWMEVLKSLICGEIPGGAEFLYNSRQEKLRKEVDEKKYDKILDAMEKLKEDQAQAVFLLEKLQEDQKEVPKYSLSEWSELFIKVLSVCSTIMGIITQIRALFQ